MELLTEKMKQFDRAQLRAAVFDLDGTLLDTVRDLGTAANVTLAHFGFPQHPLEAYQGFIGNGLLMLYRRAAPAGTDEATVEALRDYGRDYYREHCTGLTQVYDGVPELLLGWRPGDHARHGDEQDGGDGQARHGALFSGGAVPLHLGQQRASGR